jgi:hypothetical protein
MRKVVLTGLICAIVLIAGCEHFRKTPTPTPDPASFVSPTSILLSPIPIIQTPAGTPGPTTASPGAAATETLSILSVTGAKPGEAASVSIQGPPNTQCTLAFIAPPGSKTVGLSLDPKTADASGHVTWTWKVDPGAATGPGAVTAKCGGAVVSSSITIG